MPGRKSLYFIIIITILYAGVILPATYLAFLLLVHGITLGGRLFAAGTLLLLSAPILISVCVLWRTKTSEYLLAGAFLVGITAYGICYVLAPSGYNLPKVPVQSHYAAPAEYYRASLANLVPEIDQLLLGSYLLPGLDPYIDTKQATRIRQVFLKIYTSMRKSRDFKQLGSVLGQTYRDIFFDTPAGSHFYEYIPENNTNSLLPVIVFVHGSLGNFKGYLWVLKTLADEKGFAIVAPTFGAGNWNKTGGTARIEHMLEYCTANPRLDASQVYLAGLSNGGIGVLLAARKNPMAYKGLILLSAVIDPVILQDRDFIRGWKNKPVLIIHGECDRRIPVSHTKKCESLMKQNHIPVTSRYYPGQDHFLLFAEDKQVMHDISEWITR